MNGIYRGRVTQVEIQNPDSDSIPAAIPFSASDGEKVAKPDEVSKPAETRKSKIPDGWQPLEQWEDALWQDHELFQDAVNYYIVALAALGSSPDSKLTRLRGLLDTVWDRFDKKGQ